MNADERRLKTLEVVPVPGSSSAALTDSFTSSNLLFILFIIGKVPTKAWRARNTRASAVGPSAPLCNCDNRVGPDSEHSGRVFARVTRKRAENRAA